MKIRKLLLTFILLTSAFSSLFSQIIQENLQKYWLYRDRLKYFVVVDPQNNFGTNIPFYYRTYYNPRDNVDLRALDVSDGNDILQYYIGMLATEYALLKKYNMDYTKTRNELLYALNAVERLDLYAENYFRKLPNIYSVNIGGKDVGSNKGYPYFKVASGGKVQEGDLNGFFVRDDIDSIFIETWSKKPGYSHLTNYKKERTGFTEGIGHQMPLEQSKDNVWNYLINFALVYVLVDDTEIKTKVQDITFRMIKNLHFNYTQKFPLNWIELITGNYTGTTTTPIWRIINPVTKLEVTEGSRVEEGLFGCGSVDGFNYGFAEAGNFITNYTNNTKYEDLHFGCSNQKEDKFYNFIAYPLLWSSAYPHFSLATICGNTPIYQKYSIYDASIDRHQSIMDALMLNMGYPLASQPTILEHLPLIRLLIVLYQIENGNFTNQIDIESFNYAKNNLELKEFYENLLFEAPICGPKNLGPNEKRVDNWCLENRLTKSHAILMLDPTDIDPNRIGIDNAYNNGIFTGIDYLLLHNLYWLCFVPSEVYTNMQCDNQSKIGRLINSNCTIQENSDISYTASEKITLQPGFKAQKGCVFKATINTEWNYAFKNPSNIIEQNNCYCGIPFTNETPTYNNLKSFTIQNLNIDTISNIFEINQNFIVFPNPNKGNFKINFLQPNYNYSIYIYTSNGIKIDSFNSNYQETLDIIINNSGVYIIQIELNNQTIFKNEILCY